MNVTTPVTVVFHDLLGEPAVAQADQLSRHHALLGAAVAGRVVAMHQVGDNLFKLAFGHN